MTADIVTPKKGADWRLCLMMFLEYASKGIWVPLAALFLMGAKEEGGLGFEPNDVFLIVGVATAIGAITSPIIGQIADRYFSTERVMAVLLILAGLFKITMSFQTTFTGWMIFAVCNAIVYMPTMALTNSLAMAHLSDPKKSFPIVRVWGTVGWIAVSFVFPALYLMDAYALRWLPPFFYEAGVRPVNTTGLMLHSLRFGGAISIGYAIFCAIGLPHTPPKRDAVQKLALLEAAKLMRHRSFSILIVATLLLSVVHVVQMVLAGQYLKLIGLDGAYVSPALSIGQFSELAFMALTGVLLTALGYRKVLALGALAYCLRHFIYGFSALPLEDLVLAGAALILGVLILAGFSLRAAMAVGAFAFCLLHLGAGSSDVPLGVIISAQGFHGAAFAFFVAAGFIYVNALAPEDVRHSAQTLFFLVFLGLGPFLAAVVTKVILPKDAGLDEFQLLWRALAIVAFAACLLIIVAFRDETKPAAGAEPTTEN